MAEKSDTKQQILDIAERLLERRGYNAFSYQDIADELGIRKASLHYHYASKADLGMALTSRHAQRMATLLRNADERNLNAWEKLDIFVTPFIKLIKTGVLMTPTASLAADYDTLPEQLQARTAQFYSVFHDWLTHVLMDGRHLGQFYFGAEPSVKAYAILATLEGSILIARSQQNAAFIDAVIDDVKASLGA